MRRILLAATTGMPRGEVLGLRWRDDVEHQPLPWERQPAETSKAFTPSASIAISQSASAPSATPPP